MCVNKQAPKHKSQLSVLCSGKKGLPGLNAIEKRNKKLPCSTTTLIYLCIELKK